MNFAPTISAQNPARNRPFFKAAVFEEFIRLTNEEHLPLVAAARALGIPASSVSGKSSMLARYVGGGLAGLERHRSGAAASDLSQQIEALGWFVPVAQFFYLLARRRRGALVAAIRRASALPNLPLGWRSETRARFLGRLGLEAAPGCPANLRAELKRRELAGMPIVPPRIARLVKMSPASIRRHVFQAPARDLERINLSAIATRLAGLDPGGNCRLTLELL